MTEGSSVQQKLLTVFWTLAILAAFHSPWFSAAEAQESARKCIMVFGAHADDVEEMAGGTFARYIAEGYQGVYVCVVNNFAGNQIEKVPGNYDFVKGNVTSTLTGSHHNYPVGALETLQIRSEEALEAARVFHAVPVLLDFQEPEIWLGRKPIVYGTEDFINYDPPGRKHVSLATSYSKDVEVVVDLLARYRPEITIIHCLGGEKLDHAESGYLVYLAFQKAIARNVPVGKLWMVRYGWLSDSTAQRNGRGRIDVSIDISKYRSIKYEAWNRHLSQNGGEIEADLSANFPAYKQNLEEFITVIDNTKRGKSQ
jgi:LmbE family N-acetylglucosaminyl deacetylase